MAPDRTLQYSDAIHLLTFNPDTVQTCSLVRIGVARTESKRSVNSLFASIATAVSDRCWLGLSELLTSPLIIAHLHLTGLALINELVGVCPDVKFYTKCTVLGLIYAVLTAHLCSYNLQQCDATP